METKSQLADRFRELFLNGKWIAGTNYKEQLESVSWEQATKKVGSLNTIALLTFHINYYLEGVLNVFEGGKLEIQDKYSFDAPAISSEDEWKDLLNSFCSNAEKFARHIDKLSENELDSVFVEEKYGTYRRNIEGMIEHSYYHFGQISLIKKMVSEKSK